MRAPETFDLNDLLKWLVQAKARRAIQPAGSPIVIDGPHLRLQHDIDFSPQAALHMARHEEAIEVRATYCFLLGSDFYDLTHPAIVDILGRILACGHTLGLHFDPQRYAVMGLGVPEGVRRDLAIFRVLGFEAEMICCHRPRKLGLPGAPLLKELKDRGAPPFPDRLGETYVSDSAQGFSHQGAEAMADPPPALRLNLHPEWWLGAERLNVLNSVLQQRALQLNDAIGAYADIDQHPHAVEQRERDGKSGNPARLARARPRG